MASQQEFFVKTPQRNDDKNYYVMKFNASLGVDVSKWNQVRMVREVGKKDKAHEEEIPQFGAGSEFGRQQKEDARRKKFGFAAKKKNAPDAKPWLMRVGSKKDGKHYRGIREGGVTNNTTYYVFTHAQDGSFEIHPVKEWYNFTPRVTYKTLNAEEAEEKFSERNKILNHFAVLINKKLRPDAEDAKDGDEEGVGSKGGKSSNSFKISDMDDWVDSEDGLDSSGSDDDDEGGGGKKSGKEEKGKGKDSRKKKKKSKEDANNEAFEDSDDGDDEGREVDYITDESSESETEMQEAVQQKGVDQDEGLAKLLDSDSSSEDEDEKKKKANDDEENEDQEEEGKGKKNKKKKGGKKENSDQKGIGGKEGGDEKSGGIKSASASRSTTPTPGEGDGKNVRAEKRKALVDNLMDLNVLEHAAKKSRMDPFTQSSAAASSSAATSAEAMFEEDVRRYLARKPMTTTEILKKIKSRKTGLQKEELMPLLVSALKRINPHKQKVKGIMYLSLKSKA